MKPMSFLVVDDNSVALREIYEKNPEKAESYFRTALRVDPGFKDARQVLNAIELGFTSEL